MSQAEVLFTAVDVPADAAEGAVSPLSQFGKGDQGIIVSVGGDGERSALGEGELERRLLELGFVEGAALELLHEGLIGRDPIAVRVDDMRVALRRREAATIFVRRTGRRA